MAITDTAANPTAFEEGLQRLALVGMMGRAVIDAMVRDGVIETRPGDDDPGAIALMHRLSAKSRQRWPAWADSAARLGLPERAKR